MIKHLALLSAIIFSLSANAEETLSPSLESVNARTYTTGDTIQFNTKSERFFSKRWVQSTYIGVPLVAAGLIEMCENKHFRSLRNGFMPTFRNHLDDYIQYSPAAVMLALKAAGVESRSSWKKMLTADAFTIGLITAVTRVVKPIAKEERPDGSNNHSFPSGHTATAFMCATMLQKEYGHLSPWVGFGGYTVATVTGVMRMMNNKHWMSDILAGAGIGILGTEFGYWLADLAFPSHPKSYDPHTIWLVDADKNPSFFGTYAGFLVPLHHYNISSTRRMQSSTGATFGLEGAYFFSRHWGVGARAGVYDIKYTTDDEDRMENSSHSYTLKGGVYFHQDIYERLFVEGRALAGYTRYPDTNDNIIDNPSHGGLGTTLGAGIGVRARQHLDFKFNVEHELFPSPSKDHGSQGALVLSGSAYIRF